MDGKINPKPFISVPFVYLVSSYFYYPFKDPLKFTKPIQLTLYLEIGL